MSSYHWLKGKVKNTLCLVTAGRWLLADIDGDDATVVSKLEKHQQQFRKLQEKMRLSNLVLTVFLILLFAVVPLLLFFARNHFGYDGSNGSVYELYFGAANRDFLVGLNQWWRIFTFPFANGSLFTILWYGFVLYGVAKTSEIYLKWWRMVVCLVIGYPLTGLCLSLCMPFLVLSSSAVIIFLLCGCALVASSEDRRLVAVFLRQYQILLVGVGLLLLPFFTGHYVDYLTDLTGFCLGAGFGVCFHRCWLKTQQLVLVYPVVVVLALLAVIMVVLLLQVVGHHRLPNVNDQVVNTLQNYFNARLMSKGRIQSFFADYYFANADMYFNF